MRIKQVAKLAKLAVTEHTSTPVQLIHFITSRCNARCSFCFYWNELNKVTGGLGTSIVKDLAGLDYAWDGRTLMPHDGFDAWVLERAASVEWSGRP